MKRLWIGAFTLAILIVFCVCPECMDNCLQCGGGGCLTCRESYFVNSNVVCQKCSEEGCEQCAKDTCTKCLSGYQFEESKCYLTGEGRLYLIIGMIFVLVIVVALAFLIIWKWKAIAQFFKKHEDEVERMKKAEKQGSNWITSVMAHNKILPSNLIADMDDSRAEINKNAEISSTVGDHGRSNKSQEPQKKEEGQVVLNAKISEKDHPPTNYKDKSEWVLNTDDPRPEHQKISNYPSNQNLTPASPREGQHSNLSSSRLGEVDDDCAQDFLKDTFKKASETDIHALKSDR